MLDFLAMKTPACRTRCAGKDSMNRASISCHCVLSLNTRHPIFAAGYARLPFPPVHDPRRRPTSWYRNFIIARFLLSWVADDDHARGLVDPRTHQRSFFPSAGWFVGSDTRCIAGAVCRACDRPERKRKMLLRGMGLYVLCTGILLLLSTGFAGDHLAPHSIAWLIYAIIFVPAPSRVHRSRIWRNHRRHCSEIHPAQCGQLGQGTWLSASVTGHAMGGLLIYWLGITGTLICVCSLGAAGLGHHVADQTQNRHVPDPVRRNTWDSVKEGLRFVFRTGGVGRSVAGSLRGPAGGAVAMVLFSRATFCTWARAGMDF